MKPFKTIDEQIKLLQSRSLIIQDTEKAKKYLIRNNYYNVINMYGKLLSDNFDKYIKNASFDEITEIHYFDKELKDTLFKYISEAEKHFKSVIAYCFAETYPNQKYAYLNTNNFADTKPFDVSKLISDISQIIQKKLHKKRDNAIKHYYNKHGDVPIWVLINEMTFGQTINFYKNLKPYLKNRIATELNDFLNANTSNTIKITPNHILSYMKNICEIRNCVAHNNKLLGYNCRETTLYHQGIYLKYNVSRNDYRQDVYNVIICLQIALTKNQFAQLHNTILKRAKNLEKKLHSISVDVILGSLGYPKGWCQTSSKLKQ